eukprot:12121836-Heterocapsa_arctica.AAC.1
MEISEDRPRPICPFLLPLLNVGQVAEFPANSLEPTGVPIHAEAVGFPGCRSFFGRNLRFATPTLVVSSL